MDDVQINENAGVFTLLNEPHENLEELLSRVQKGFLKEGAIDSIHICVFNQRLVDGFILNAARAIYLENLPSSTISGDAKRIDVMNIDKLDGSQDMKFIMRVIAYYHSIVNTKDEEMKDRTHLILTQMPRCREISEQYFDSNWKDPGNSLHRILEAESVDKALIDEIYYNELENLKQEVNEELDESA